MKKAIFPEYLNSGSNGAAVNAIIFLFMLTELRKYNQFNRLKVEGDYGEELEAVVKNYQREKGLEIDGHCGPETQLSIRRDLGIDNIVVPIIPGLITATKAIQPNGKVKFYNHVSGEVLDI